MKTTVFGLAAVACKTKARSRALFLEDLLVAVPGQLSHSPSGDVTAIVGAVDLQDLFFGNDVTDDADCGCDAKRDKLDVPLASD